MVDVGVAFYSAMKYDPNLGALTENLLGDTIDEADAANPNDTLKDALRSGG